MAIKISCFSDEQSIFIVPSQQKSLPLHECQHVAAAHHLAPRRRKRSIGSIDKPKVSFSEVTIRHYPIILGDNPGGKTEGPPLSIGWEHFAAGTMNLDEYEGKRAPRRDAGHLVIHPRDRTAILRRSGVSINAIITAKMRIMLEREQRSKAIYDMLYGRELMTEMKETISHTALNILSLGSRKRQERKLLGQYGGGAFRKTGSQLPNWHTIHGSQ